MGEKVIPLIPEEMLRRRVMELAETVRLDYEGKSLILVCVLHGSFMFSSDLMKLLPPETEIDFVDVSSYGKGMKSSANMELLLDLQASVEGKHVLVIEDIADTGRTIDFVYKRLAGRGAASVKLCTLLDKPSGRILDNIHPDYVGFTIPNKFVVGYGLDFAHKYRGLQYIGYLSFDD
ncbi:MAG: hypoxanthine phosphoribosyltransferase [Defluviitaleaceae bacterium]|nr:hypoxanthine phosphoribosyltransferase [Defluviitaleaceae bacterium]